MTKDTLIRDFVFAANQKENTTIIHRLAALNITTISELIDMLDKLSFYSKLGEKRIANIENSLIQAGYTISIPRKKEARSQMT